ncbi:MAG: archaemetzincin family Zn-dependent metalloprotease [Promethearchaeota archaeon]|jgi:archaemetzincin
MSKTIYLQKIGDVEAGILIILKKNLEWFFKKFNIKFAILPDPIPLLDSEYESSKRQFDALKIKRRLIDHTKNKNYYRVLGVMDVDIFSKFLNFVFGVADLPKDKSFGSALISVSRLKESYYRRTEKIAQFEQRALKEAIHELGHTFNLDHCENLCIMRFSNSIEDTDKKPHNFCEQCLKKLNSYFSNSA